MRRRAIVWGAACVGAVARPIATAQHTARMPRVGLLTPGSPPQPGEVDGFAEGLRDQGYLEGKTIVVERRHAHGHLEQLPVLVEELVRLAVDVIVVQGPAALPPAMAATKRIPIVMAASSADPVGEGLVSSLAHPGGNVTGLTYAVSNDRFGKQLQLLKEVVPGIRRVAVWWDADIDLFRRTVQPALSRDAGRLGLQMLDPVPALDPGGIDDALTAMKRQRADALIVLFPGASNNYRELLAAAALRQRLPTVSAFATFVRAGGLLSYGPSLVDIQRRAAWFVDRILKGTPPGELPIELPARHVLALNIATARALGLTIPQSMRLRADEVIE